MISENKIKFFSSQGFEKKTIDALINCGVDKYISWFLAKYKKQELKQIDSTTETDIKLCNDFFIKAKVSPEGSMSFNAVLQTSKKYFENEERKKNNIIYRFENGYYISVLNPQDAHEEGTNMSNCITGYGQKIKNGELGILALKQLNGRTVAHIEVKKNGMINQNYAKANAQLNIHFWKMILDFFSKNSKKIDENKVFPHQYQIEHRGSLIYSVGLIVPLNVTSSLHDNRIKQDVSNYFNMKQFHLITDREENINIEKKEDLISLIENKKNEITKEYDKLINFINTTSSPYELYLSDEIKEKIFGSKKGAYLMKGESFNIQEISPYYEEMQLKKRTDDEEIALGEQLEDAVYDNEVIEQPIGELIGHRDPRVREERPANVGIGRLRNALRGALQREVGNPNERAVPMIGRLIVEEVNEEDTPEGEEILEVYDAGENEVYLKMSDAAEIDNEGDDDKTEYEFVFSDKNNQESVEEKMIAEEYKKMLYDENDDSKAMKSKSFSSNKYKSPGIYVADRGEPVAHEAYEMGNDVPKISFKLDFENIMPLETLHKQEREGDVQAG